MNDYQIIGFPPIEDNDCRILVLGSMPGVASLQKEEYYAHPRNLFWSLIADVVGANIPATYNEKKEILLQNHIAVWDVCKTCIRRGSLDSHITDERPNDIFQFVTTHPQLHTILFNGSKSAQLFRKHIGSIAGIELKTLPSSSPANASFSKERKLEAWRKAFQYR